MVILEDPVSGFCRGVRLNYVNPSYMATHETVGGGGDPTTTTVTFGENDGIAGITAAPDTGSTVGLESVAL